MHRLTLLALLALIPVLACGGGEADKPDHADHPDHADKADKADHSDMEHMNKDGAALQYVCKDAPDAKHDKPGKCEDGSFRTAVAPEGQTIEYFCPMHADIVDGEAGTCSECKMFLSARVKADGDPKTP